MARITLNEIAQELAQDNWKVLSTDYQNLDTEMEFLCNEGHKVFAPWKQIRLKRECPVCKQNKFKNQKQTIVSKKKATYRVLALDQASHITGWAILDNGALIKYGTYEAAASDEVARYNEIKQWFLSMCANWTPDEIAIEGIQYQANFGVTTFQTLARLQGVLLETAYEQQIAYKICPTNTWRAHCGVKGKARADRKKSMQMLIKKWYDISVSDDVADAIGIGKYAADTHISQVEIINWE